MKVTAIIQARMGSSRLPGKVMFNLLGQSVLGHVITRVKQSNKIDDVVVATTLSKADRCLALEASTYKVKIFRGSEKHVLERFYQAARLNEAEGIVRITADCPLIDPGIIDLMLEQYLQHEPACDYMSNTLKRTFPRGLDVEIFSMQALEKAYHQAKREDEKEHVTPYIYRHPEQFRLASFTHSADYSHLRWTLDTEEDWLFIQEIFQRLYTNKPAFRWMDVLELLRDFPDLCKINQHVQQKPLGDSTQ